MSIIEQAARRLEELKRSGVVIPGDVLGGEASRGAGHGNSPAAGLPGRALQSPKGSVHGRAGHTSAQDVSESEVRSKEVRIDLFRLAELGYLTPDNPRARVADEFRVIKRPLLKNIQADAAAHGGNPANLLMVTSAMPGEGKTFVSINLALSLAMELDKTVLLVDADVARPSVLSRLGLEPSNGLLDLLTDSDIDLSSVLLRTNVPGLAILPAGNPQGRATEILASDKMATLLQGLAGRYPDRILVFDAPPLLPSTESRVLASHMGQVILVVEAGRTNAKELQQALQAIEACETVFALLNKSSRSEVGTYHDYYGPADA